MKDYKVPEINIVEDKRLRRIHLTVHPQEGVIVRVPVGTSVRDAHRVVARNSRWMQEQWTKSSHVCPWREYRDGDLLPLLGKRVVLVRENSTSPGGNWQPGCVVVKAPAQTGRSEVRQLLSDLYRLKAEEYIPGRIRTINKEHFQVELGKISVRGQSKILGSCTGNGNLSFNWRLMLAPAAIVDYVIVHELAHRIEMNHSPRFWHLVSSACPEYALHRQWIRNNSNWLYI